MSSKNTQNNTPTTTTTSTGASATDYSYNKNNEFNHSINRSLDETKANIKRSLDESKNQIPRYNTIVNSYQEQSIETAKEISEEYIDSQKAIINSIQSAWKPYNESYNGLLNSWGSPESVVKAYSKFVSNIADGAVSAVRLTNNIIFSNLDSWKAVLQQARDNSRHLSNLSVNTAKTFEQNSKEIHDAAAKEAQSIKDNTKTVVNATTAQ